MSLTVVIIIMEGGLEFSVQMILLLLLLLLGLCDECTCDAYFRNLLLLGMKIRKRRRSIRTEQIILGKEVQLCI